MTTDKPSAKKRPFLWVKKVRLWIDKHRVAALIIVGTIGITIIGILTLELVTRPLSIAVPDIYIQARKEQFYSPLTGLEVASKQATTKPVTAVIIENSPDARPQSGIKQGEVVYEAIAEAGITRFMVLYQQNSPKKIGPVRSIRPYFIEWYQPYNASMAHVGGSKLALETIRNGEHRDLDEFFNSSTYWRVDDRFAPHNTYTSGSALEALNRQKKYASSKPIGLNRVDIPTNKITESPTASKVSVSMGGSATYDSSYAYDKTNNRYIRSQGGAQHKDQQEGVITPKVVVVLRVVETTQWQETDREVIGTTGSGEATIFQNGTAIKATWQRKSRVSQLTFVDKSGNEILLEPGQTWITAVPTNKGGVSWQ